jgi:phenylacetate-CoA ligase
MINQTSETSFYSPKNLKVVRETISLALKNNKFYQKKFKKARINKPPKTWEDFFQLPFTTKDELSRDQVKNPPIGTNLSCKPDKIIQFSTTSGSSTGKSLLVPYSKNDIYSAFDVWLEWDKKRGRLSRKSTIIALDSEFELIWCLLSSLNYGLRVLIPQNRSIPEAFQYLKKFDVDLLQAYPTQLFKLINYAKSKRSSLAKKRKIIVATAGEPGWKNLTVRKYIEKQFNAKWIDIISSAETDFTAYSCDKCNSYHFSGYTLAEVIDPKTGKHSDKGELVETSLIKKDGPFIRYKTGNLVEIERSQKCKQIVLKEITGRLKDETKFRGYNFNIAYWEIVLKAINPSNSYLILIYTKDNLDCLDIFYETASQKDIDKLNKYIKEFKESCYYQPSTYVLSPGKIVREKRGIKIKSVYDMRSGEMPNFNYQKLYSSKRYEQSIIRVVNMLKKVFKSI